MLAMFWYCNTKEAATAVTIVKLTFQVFNIHAFRNTVTLKTILLLLLIIFLFETWSETIRLSPGLLCTNSSTCTLSLRLSEGSSYIVISVLLSLFFFRKKLRLWSHLLEKSFMENLIFCAVDSFGLIHSSPGSHLKKYLEFLHNYAVVLLIFGVDGEANQSVTTLSYYHHRCYPCCVLLLLSVNDFHLFYFYFQWNFS